MENTTLKELEKVVIKFVGDSGDGMQLTGLQFSETSAILGNDIATFPDYPAEIRAPQGSIYGVSGFKLQLGNIEVHTPGDSVDVLVAMNPAALKANMDEVPVGKTIIVDEDTFTKKNLDKVGFETNPLEDGSLDKFHLILAPISSLTKESISHLGLTQKSILRSKNMFALGIVYWMFSRPLDHTIDFLNAKFKSKPELIEANTIVLKKGYHYADTVQILPSAYTVLPAKMQAGKYRSIMGNTALAWGFLVASEKSKRDLFLGSYPITPASDILHELSKHKHFGVITFQAEDEIAGVVAALGASFGGSLGLTTTSGPGLALKGEAIGLAVMTELPLVVVNVQRGGPSTGLPTKTEQSDLVQAMYGRNGESPVIVLAASTPGNCFDFAFLAAKLALEHMTPVILLSDGYIANGAAPWKIKSSEDMPDINPPYVTEDMKENWMPYQRDPERLNRYWAIPGTPGFEHRIGGLEKDELSGDVSYVPLNHQKMTATRKAKIEKVADFIPELSVEGEQEGDLLVVGWGGTYGSLITAMKAVHGRGKKIGLAHFNYINPLPKNVGEVFGRFKKILVCELNLGQFVAILKSKHPHHNYYKYNKVQGLPFTAVELIEEFDKQLDHD